ncbi:MAG: DUF1080 domain-containing protein [Ferruginibacter sp.]
MLKKNFHPASSFFLLAFLFVAGCDVKNEKSKEDWISLFNGKDLSGWDIKITGQPLNDNYKKTFRVEDSMIRVVYDQYKTFDDKFGHLYYRTPFSYYIIRYQYRFTGNQTPGGAEWNVRNSGVMIHSQSAKSVNINQDFPVSVEVQLLGGLDKGERPTGNVCTPGTQVYMKGSVRPEHCVNSTSKTYNGDQWVSMTVVVLGDSIVKHIVEGDTVLTYEKPQIGGGFVGEQHNWTQANITDSTFWINKAGTLLKEGYIALQAESHPVDFRRIELLNLVGCMDRNAKNFKDYYIKPDNSQCKY